MKYYWKGAEVYPVPGQTYSTHWNCYFNQPTENGGHRRIIISIVPNELTTNQIATTEVEAKKVDAHLNINLASYTAIRDALGMGIGRTAPRTFIKNRPETGYIDFAQFKKLNEGLENINWEEIEKVIVFE